MMRVSGILLALTGALAVFMRTRDGTRVVTQVDLVVVRVAEAARWEPLANVAVGVVRIGSTGTFRVLAWAVLITLLAARRFQHLFTSLVLLLVVPVVVASVAEVVGRMRPAGVEILAPWDGYAFPSRPVTEIALVSTIAVIVLAPRGPWRSWAARAVGVATLLLILSRLYTGVDHPSDIAAALALGVGGPFLTLRMLTPDEAFPVSYRRGVRAHLDVGGRRGEAIREAFAAQLDQRVQEVEPFSLKGSAGSTPLRLTTTEGALFGKLYASIHMRSDRWYKLARTVLYGRLEDERPFNSVRRLVQYEDHMLRVFRDAAVPTAAPLGIVEITPEREYILVTEMIADASDLGTAEVTDDIADQALSIVRVMWDAGIAHRDIKPSNVLVAADEVRLIDLAFAEVRPSPWRQAVDLANMMLTLALRSSPERIYDRATKLFTPAEVAEAFAASRAVTIPAQLRTMLREQEDDLVARFRELAPPRPRVAIQRWTLRRVALTLAMFGGLSIGVALVTSNLRLAGLL